MTTVLLFAVAILLLAIAGPLPAAAAAAAPSSSALIVVHLEPVSKTHLPGKPPKNPHALYEYRYRVDLRNAGDLPANVSGAVRSRLASVAIVGATLQFGIVLPGQTKRSDDTITVRATTDFDRRLDGMPDKPGRGPFGKSVKSLKSGDAADSSEQNFSHAFLWTLTIAPDPQPPTIAALSPADVLLPADALPTISASFSDPAGSIDRAAIRLIFNSEDVTAQAVINANSIRYTPPRPLVAGAYTVYLEVANKANAAANAIWGFEVDEQKRYDLAISSPAEAQTLGTSRLEVRTTAGGNKAYPIRMSVNGQAMSLSDTDTSSDDKVSFTGMVDLIGGANTLIVEAQFSDGEVRTISRQVHFDAPPAVIITSPADNAMLGRANATSPGNLTGAVERPVTITGRTSKSVQTVSINQQQAQLSNDNTEFRFENFFLHEGMNLLTAIATDSAGRTGSASLQISVDQTAPILTIESPVEESLTTNQTIDVRGVVNDAVEAFVGASEPQVSVTVNGKTTTAGQTGDRYYVVRNVPLEIGANVLTVTAVDQFGNRRSQELTIARLALGADRILAIGGNHQRAPANTELVRPLTIHATDRFGEPLANLPVQFDVMRGTGSITTAPGTVVRPDGITPARFLQVPTDRHGVARVWLTVGKQSGPGANVVRASYPGIMEEATFMATTERGAVAKVNADLGTNQFAETGSQPLELLSVVVRDRQDNTLPNVPVVFTVEEGDAYFTDHLGGVAQAGGRRMVINTDKNGMAALRPRVGSQAGIIRIVARALKESGGSIDLPGDLTGNATYVIQAKTARDGPANFRGVVYTDKGLPLPGVRVSVGRTGLASITTEQGVFELDNVPPGRIDLFVDGRSVNPTNDPSRQQWPSLHFEVFAVKGQDNSLAHPIYLPPLLMSHAKTVGGNEDVILTLPGLGGFHMKVKANSVTFPDGSRVGTLVVSPVTADRLPMAPPAGGTTFGIPAWTIQPAGTRFDPPIEVQLPNARANPAGDNIPIVQWDHDLAQYVPMGRATVSEDGAVLVTDAGSGITKAGWGGACVYEPDRCAKNNKKCADCFSLKGGPSGSAADCPQCEFDSANVNGAEISRPFNFALKNWGPGKVVKDIMRLAFGAEVGLEFGVVGQKTDSFECCNSTKNKQNILQGQVAFQGEAIALFDLNGVGAVGRALRLAGLNAGINGRISSSGQASGQVHDCPDLPEIKERWDVAGGLGGGLELIVNVGELGNFTVFGFQGSGGVEVTGQIITNRESKRPNFDINSFLNAHVQGDVILLNQKVSGIRLQIPLIVNNQASARVLFP